MIYKAIFYLNGEWAGTSANDGDFKRLWKSARYELRSYKNENDRAFMIFTRSTEELDNARPFVTGYDHIICTVSNEHIIR